MRYQQDERIAEPRKVERDVAIAEAVREYNCAALRNRLVVRRLVRLRWFQEWFDRGGVADNE